MISSLPPFIFFVEFSVIAHLIVIIFNVLVVRLWLFVVLTHLRAAHLLPGVFRVIFVAIPMMLLEPAVSIAVGWVGLTPRVVVVSPIVFVMLLQVAEPLPLRFRCAAHGEVGRSDEVWGVGGAGSPWWRAHRAVRARCKVAGAAVGEGCRAASVDTTAALLTDGDASRPALEVAHLDLLAIVLDMLQFHVLVHAAFGAVRLVAALDGALVVSLDFRGRPSMPLALVIAVLPTVLIVGNLIVHGWKYMLHRKPCAIVV